MAESLNTCRGSCRNARRSASLFLHCHVTSVPGFLILAILAPPAKVIERLRKREYFSYALLLPERLAQHASSRKSTLARLLAGEEDDDRDGELDLTPTHYGAITATVERLTEEYGTPAQAEKIRAHHRNVFSLASSFNNWKLAMR
jgi:hypothetical protein